jgi:catechol 2,3-dioxygenase-like lactoylglutathione lyase family enzyme
MPSWSIEHISAVTLAVRDMAESVAFYRTLGLDVTYGGPDAPFTTLRADQAVINLRRAAAGGDNAWSRVILRVRGVDALHRELAGKGVVAPAPRNA